jgi:hypothetical protein
MASMDIQLSLHPDLRKYTLAGKKTHRVKIQKGNKTSP